MSSSTDDARLIEFGKQVRERRKALRISIRKLAEDSRISPSYISAIESGRNPATGRPPEPSVGVVERLHRALEITDSVFGSSGNTCVDGCDHNHVLLYRMDDELKSLAEILEEGFGADVQQWLCISDPRRVEESDENFISWHWPFGELPYPDTYLIPDRIGDALDTRVESIADAVSAQDYGLVIADCSAVMRWIINPESEIDYEDRWHARSTEILQRHIGRQPKLNICVYSHRDIEALEKQIDVLDTILRLFSVHSQTFVVDHAGHVLSGPEAVAAVLAESRPGGVSSSAWRSLCGAAAISYAG